MIWPDQDLIENNKKQNIKNIENDLTWSVSGSSITLRPPAMMWWEGKKVARKREGKKVRKWSDLISLRKLHHPQASSNDVVGGQDYADCLQFQILFWAVFGNVRSTGCPKIKWLTKKLNHNSVLWGQIYPSKWLGSAWSWLFLVRIDQNQTKWTMRFL